jgi:hypothetical protein
MHYARQGARMMPYTIKPDLGTVSDERETIVEAVEYARELLRLGMKDVKIRCPDGRVYGPTDFDGLAREDSAE